MGALKVEHGATHHLRNPHFELVIREKTVKKYRKIPNTRPGPINIFKNNVGGLYSGELIFGGLTFGGHFVFVYVYSRLENLLF